MPTTPELQDLLDHAQFGSLPIVELITALNGISEQLYFRGALYAGVGRKHAAPGPLLLFLGVKRILHG